VTGAGAGSRLFAGRAAIALAQGAALWLLTRVWGLPGFPRSTLEPLVVVAATVPTVLLFGLGRMRPAALLAWGAAVATVAAGLGLHDAARGGADDEFHSVALALATAAALFVGHTLAVDADAERRFMPSYARHFDTAWKHALQVALTAVFVGLAWLVLGLGAGLFKLLGVEAFTEVITQRWFAFLATALAAAAGIHATDAQPALIRGARSLVLALFSWLAPVLAGIVLAFLLSLPVLSLSALWATHFAGALLLSAALGLIVMVNCCYQDGGADRVAGARRVAASLACIELVPLVALAAWALRLRVGQYGWSAERVLAAAAVIACGCYAVGYGWAALSRGTWLKRIEAANFTCAYVVLCLFLSLFSPLADPARLMVADQMARLRSGLVAAGDLDVMALRFDGARWGSAALAGLARADDPALARRSAAALAATGRYAVLDPPDPAGRITAVPGGRPLPAALTDGTLWPASGEGRPSCFGTGFDKCIARFVTLPGGAREAILFKDRTWSLLEQDEQGHWRRTGAIHGPAGCPAFERAMTEDPVGLAGHDRPDLLVGGLRAAILPPGACDAPGR